MSDLPNLDERAIVLNAADNVATALVDIPAGDYAYGDGAVTVATDIQAGFKLAVREIAGGADVLKYGYVIGKATADIAPGECVHVHNIDSAV